MDDLSNLYDPVRERIFRKIEETGISQKELANKLGVSPQTITDWKNGKSNSFSRKLHLLAPILGVPTVWLLSGDEDAKKPAAGDGDGVSENEAIFRALPPDLQEEALRYMRYLAAQAGTHEDPKD